MSTDNRYGEPRWRDANRYTPEGQIDHTKQENQELKREILRMKVHIQAQELDALTEKILRDERPAVKDAWEKYQTVLRLSKK